jgi:hypothetical protein
MWQTLTRPVFLVQQHTHIFESIKFADQKAGVITAISTAIAALLFGMLNDANPKLPLSWMFPALLVFLLLFVTFYHAIRVIWPRPKDLLDCVNGGDLAIPEKVAKLKQPYFLNQIIGITEDKIVKELAALVYQRSVIRAYKFERLDRAFVLSLGAYPLAVGLAAAILLRCVHVCYFALILVFLGYVWKRKAWCPMFQSDTGVVLSTRRLEFKAATDQLITPATLPQIARACGVSVNAIESARIESARMDSASDSYQSPPADWEITVAKLARERSCELRSLAEDLERQHRSRPNVNMDCRPRSRPCNPLFKGPGSDAGSA